MKLNDNIKYLKGVGEKRAEFLSKLGIHTVGDLLRFYPRNYEDWRNIISIDEAQIGENCCIRAIVDRKPVENRIRKGMTLYKTDVTDGKSIMQITIFNSKYAAEKLHEGEEYLFFGRVAGNLWKKEMNTPQIEKALGGDRIRPIYHCTGGLSTGIIEKLVKTALNATEGGYADCIPEELRKKHRLCAIDEAVKNIHLPLDSEHLESARRRLIFEELMLLQIGLLRMKRRSRCSTDLKIKEDFTKEFLGLLPFEMTGAQKRAVNDAVGDMKKDISMNRLLQGDVGSGKTAVAGAVVYNAAKNGMQSVLMAPTEILALQHFRTFSEFFKNTDISCELMTGSTKASEKKRIKEQIGNGSLDFVIGTHALIQKDVDFSRLGLVITDEQHRFGVRQRSALGEKGYNPHTLVMSATPIPRTLALIIYGDLDISVLDELPPGRIAVSTYAIPGSKRIRAYNYIKQHLDRGLQAYIVCPLVEEGESEVLAAASEYAEKLSKDYFSSYTVGMLHGKMKSADKERVMSDFVQGRIQLLVSTTVIEVGVDVPNAVIMLIENAERFGLSQLHQLRGRIGRGSEASTCILVSDAQNAEAVKRIKLMTQTSDGFRIADEDLQMRGPGDFFGSKQHGLPELKIADMLKDSRLLREASAAAQDIIADDPELIKPENKFIRMKSEKMFKSAGKNGLN